MTKRNDTARAYFGMLANPADHGYADLEPKQVIEKMARDWMAAYPGGSCALSYCVSKDGLHHVHAELENGRTMRFSAVKKVFPGMHLEETQGTRKDVMDYIAKTGKFAEKGERVIETYSIGEIQGRTGRGHRSDLDEIARLLDEGLTPEQVYSVDFKYRRFDRLIRAEYFARLRREMPDERELSIHWHCGEAGSGKSHVQVDLKREYGRDSVYVMTDYEGGGLDGYSSEPILFLDELRDQLPYDKLLTMLDKYPNDIHARYSNKLAAWREVHIASVWTPDMVHKYTVGRQSDIDTYDQLKRRITDITYHEKVGDDYLSFTIPMEEYEGLDKLKADAYIEWSG